MAIFTNITIIIGQSFHKAGYTSSLYGCPCVDSMVTCGTDNVFKLIKKKKLQVKGEVKRCLFITTT